MSLVLKLPENTKGRDFIVADIHGCYAQFEKALKAVNFDPENDRLFAIGDLVDRGPLSVECLYYLSQPWFFALRGNHEDMLCFAIKDGGLVDDSMFKGGLPTFVEWIREETAETRVDLKSAFEKLPYAIEVQTKKGAIGLVHADIPEGMDWKTFTDKVEDNETKVLRIAAWSHRRLETKNTAGVEGIDRVFFGHSPVAGPKKLGNCFFCDTGGVFRLMNETTEDFYISIININASDDEILNPRKTADDLVRTVTGSPKPDLKPSADRPRPPAL